MEVQSSNPVETMRALEAAPDVEKTSMFGTAVHAVLKSRAVDLAALRNRLQQSGLRVISMEPVLPSLEDVFLDVVEQAGER